MIKYFQYNKNFQLESGEAFNGLKIAYSIYGDVNAEKTIWVCHALSGNSLVADWWSGIFGEGRFFDFSKYRVICANVVGSCYGTTGPDDEEDYTDYPLITIRDMVNAHELLRDHLGIESIDILIGASLGGQQALEWAIKAPEVHKRLILIATNAVHSPFGRAFNEAQRLALKADPTFGKQGGGEDGLSAARAIAMLSYRSYEDFKIKQADEADKTDDYRGASYVKYQGDKFKSRFKAGAYYTLSKAMDSHDISRNRGGLEIVLGEVNAETLVVGVDSDLLFPLSEQKFLAQHIPDAHLGVIHSQHGHDAFLIEYDQLIHLLDEFLNNDFQRYKPTTLKTTLKQ